MIFLYNSSVHSCHLFLIFSASVRSIPLLSFIKPIFEWNVPLVSLIFLKRSLVSHSIVFLYVFALTAEKFFLISPCYSLELWIQMGLSFLFSFVFHFYLSYFWGLVRQPLCISFSLGWYWSLPPVQCHKPLSLILQALCVSDLIPWIYLSLPLYNCKGFDLDHTSMV